MSARGAVLVTGARGFIGTTLLALGQRQGRASAWVGVDYDDADLRDRDATLRLLERIKPERVVHLAGKLVKVRAPRSCASKWSIHSTPARCCSRRP